MYFIDTNVLDSMSKAVENASVFIPVLTEKYKTSPACRQGTSRQQREGGRERGGEGGGEEGREGERKGGREGERREGEREKVVPYL